MFPRNIHPEIYTWYVNTGKRLMHRPKLYFRDSGLFHALLNIEDERDLGTHRMLGASWEGFALEQMVRSLGLRDEELAFWSTHYGAEVDLLWQRHGALYAVGVKYADAPKRSRSMQSAVSDLKLEHLWVIYPGDISYPLTEKISVLPLSKMDTIQEASFAAFSSAS